jgi:uncharacterized protein (DUF1778 family)
MKMKKTERIGVRASSQQLATLRAAARVKEQNLSEFILGAAVRHAQSVLSGVHWLTPDEQAQLEEALGSPVSLRGDEV